MADERRTKAVLEYEARVDRAIQNIERLIHRVGDIRQTLGIVNQSASKTGNELRSSFDGAEKSASRLSHRLDEIAKKRLRGTLPSQAGSLDDLRGSLTGGSVARGGVNLGRVDSAATMTGRALSGLGQEELGSVLVKVGDAAQIGQVLQRTAEGTGAIAKAAQSLLSVAGPVAIGIGLAATAFAVLNAEMEKGKGAVQGYIDGQKAEGEARLQAAKDLRTLTSDQIRERARDLQDQIAINNEQLKLRTKQRDDTKRDLDEAIKNEDNLKIMALGQTFKQLDEDAARLTGESLNLKLEYIATTAVLGPLIKMREQDTMLIQDQLERRRQFTEAISQEDKEAKTSDLQAQIEFNKKWLAENAARRYVLRDEAISAVYDKLDAETKKLTLDLEALKNTMPSVLNRDDLSIDGDDLQRGNELQGELVDTRARELEFIEKGAAALNDFADEMDRVAEDRGIRDKREQQDFSAKRLQDQLAFTRRQAENDAAHYKDRARKIASFNAELGQEEAAALRERAKEVESLNLEQLRAAEDFARTIRGIQDSIGDAAANLDAVGVRAAKRQLRDATEQYETERRRRDQDADRKLDEMAENAEVEKAQRVKAFQDQLADEDAQYEEDRRRDQDAFRIQQQQEDDARRVRLERQREDDARQDERRRQSFEKQIANLQKQLLEPEEKLKYESGIKQRKIISDMLHGIESDMAATKARVTGSTADLANSVASAAAASAGSRSSAMTTTATVYNRGVSTGGSNASLGGGADSFARRFGNGGSFGAGEFGVVGDRFGPELVQFGQAGRVFSPEQTRGMLGEKTFQNYGDVYLNGNPAPAELEAQVENFMAAVFDRLADGETD